MSFILKQILKQILLLGLLLVVLIILGSMPAMAEPNVLGVWRSETVDALRQQHWICAFSGIVLFVLSVTITFLLWLKCVHRQLQQVKDRNQAILETIPDLIFEIGLDGRYYDTHSVHPNLFVASGEELRGKTVSDVMPQDAAEICMSALHEAYVTGMSTGKQIVLPLAQGMRWFELSVSRKTVRQGEEPRLILLSRDITEHVKLERVIRERDRHFRNLVESWPDEIARYDSHCRRVYINPHMEKTVGAFDHSLSQSPTECYPDSLEAAFFESKLREVLETGVSQSFERAWDTPAIQPSYRAVRMIAELDDDGVITGVFVIARDITEARIMEAALRGSEQQFRTLAEHSPDVVARFDRDSRYVYCNSQMLEIIGRAESEVLGRTPLELRNDEFIQLFQDKIETVAITGLENELVMLMPTRPGVRKIHDHVRFTPEFDAAGQVVYVLVVGRDISALKEAESQMSTLVENLPDFVVRLDTCGRHLYVSPAVTKAFRESEWYFIGRTAVELNFIGDPVNNQILLDSAVDCAVTGRSNKLEMTFRQPFGNHVFDITHVPELDEFGRVKSVLAVSRDITARKAMEDQLAQREQEFRTLVENAPDLIFRYDHECHRIYVNKAVEKLTGQTAEELLGATPDDVCILDANGSKRHMQCIQHVLETCEPYECEVEYITSNQRKYVFNARLVPEYDQTGKTVSVLAIARDITELKKNERRLQESEHLLRQLAARSEVVREDERKSLAREVHDELGQHLMALRMSVTAIGLKFGGNNLTLQNKIDRILAVMDSTIKVVHNVVASLRPKVLDIGVVPALEWLVDEFQRYAGISCELHTHDENIYLDDNRATAVFRIVQESLTNIGQHAGASMVDIVLEQTEDKFVLQVRDNGRGFDSAVRKYNSFGLVGMRERVLMLEGEIEISSTPGCGTVVRVSIPVSYME